jgi:hypothetical protein
MLLTICARACGTIAIASGSGFDFECEDESVDFHARND